MALAEEFERSGVWLFRWRSYLPLVFVALVLLSMRQFQFPGDGSGETDALWESVCVGISFVGLGIRVATIGHVPKKTSGRNTSKQIAESLNTTGMYSLVRHPLYLGNFFLALGPALFPRLWWLAVIYILLFWVYYERIMFAEEAFLRRQFGEAYMEWADKVPPFLPNFRNYLKSELPFSVKTILKREYNALLGVVASFFALDVVGDYVVEGFWDVDPAWVVLLGLGLFAWVALYTLKKTTRWLNVEGR